MKTLLTAFVAFVASSAIALAADLPSRKAAAEPTAATNAFALSGWYAGGYVGGNNTSYRGLNVGDTAFVMGGVVGYEWNEYLRTEVTFDNTAKASPTTAKHGQALFANAILQYPVGWGLTPYVLGGTGFGWNAWGKGDSGITDDAKAIYNVGGGLRYAVTDRFELDGRYRYVNAYSGTKFKNNNVVTLGANYKF